LTLPLTFSDVSQEEERQANMNTAISEMMQSVKDEKV
jgi:hypothetical protein